MSNPKGCNSKENKFKVGDKVVVVDAKSVYDTYKNGDTGVVVAYDSWSASAGYVRREDGELMNVYWSEVELIEGEKDSKGAESLRDSILSLQQERVSLQEQIEQNIAQEKALTEQLKELGFLLAENKEQPTNVVEEKKSVLYAEDIEEDMTDSRNWKVGDIIVATSHGYNNRLGVEYRVTKVGETIRYECLDSRFTKNEYVDSSEYEWLSSNYKFHSRPVVN